MSEHLHANRPFAYACEFNPMPFEVDFTGYLSNTVVVRWMEILRVQMMRMHFAEIDTGAKEHLSVIIRTEIEYVNAVRYGERIGGMAWVNDVTGARWRIGFSFQNESRHNVAISAKQEGTFLSPTSFRPVRVPEIIREKFFALPNAVT